MFNQHSISVLHTHTHTHTYIGTIDAILTNNLWRHVQQTAFY
jgi:hypothetical protein